MGESNMNQGDLSCLTWLCCSYIDIEITILAVSNIRTNKPKKEGHLTPLGYERTIWVVYDLKRLSESIGPDKKLTSSEFKSDGEW